MNINETQVTNALILSFFMVNVSHRLLRDLRCHQPEAGVLDLKTFFRSRRYVIEVIKTLDREPQPFQFKAHSTRSPNSALFIRRFRVREARNWRGY